MIPDSGLDRAISIDILVSNRFIRPAMARLRQRLALLLSLAGLTGVGLAPAQAFAGSPEALKISNMKLSLLSLSGRPPGTNIIKEN